MEEKWKWVEGYEGLYEVSNKGRVKSHIKHKIMKLNLHSKLKKYYSIMLYKDEIPKRFLVHRLVALAFIENPENENFVNHNYRLGQKGCKASNKYIVFYIVD